MIYIFKSTNFCSNRWLGQLNTSVMICFDISCHYQVFQPPVFVDWSHFCQVNLECPGRTTLQCFGACTQIAPTHSQLINPVNFRYFAAQDWRLWETDHFYIRFNLRHISHCCLVPAIRSHSVTHCARCGSVCFIVPLGMHAAVSQPHCLTVRA